MRKSRIGFMHFLLAPKRQDKTTRSTTGKQKRLKEKEPPMLK